MAAAHVLAQLGPQAAAAATPSCFDTAQSGASLWAAARAGERSVAVVHGRPAGGGGGGGLHALLELPEPVAALQLGVPTPAAGAAPAGCAVLLAVGSSGRAWAFQLHAPGAASASAAPARLAADAAFAAAVPVAQQRCAAASQLAAAVAWEHLAYAWEPAAAAGSGRPGRGGTRAPPPAAPLSLSQLHAALQRQQQRQQALAVHSVASWVCQQAGAAPAIPPDAVAAAYMGVASAAAADADVPRVACGGRPEAPASACSGGGRPAGYLAVATAGGQLLALPVGLPYDGSAGDAQAAAAAAAAASGQRLQAAVCWRAAGAGGGMHLLPAPAAQASVSECARLALLAESGRLLPAAAASLAGSEAVTITPGSHQEISRQAEHHGVGQPFAAAVQVVGARAVAAAGSRLYLLPGSGDGGGCSLRCLDASSGLNAAAAVPAAAVQMPPGVGRPRLVAAAAPPPGSEPAWLVLLTDQGSCVAAPCPSSTAGEAALEGTAAEPSARELERSMQALLGSIAELSGQQEALDARHRQLDASLAALAAAIPAAQGVAAAPGARDRLHCSLRPRALRSQALGCGGGSANAVGGGSSGGGEVVALEVQLDNRSGLPLQGGWSVVLAHAGDSHGGGDGGGVAFATPLGSLPPGAQWRQECLVPLAAGSHGAAAGQLYVLLCRHGGPGGSGSESSVSHSSGSVLLLHRAELDALHLLRLRGGGRNGPPPAAAADGSDAVQARAGVALQLPASLGAQPPAAGTLLEQLLEEGLSSRPQLLQPGEHPEAAVLPSPAFSLLLPPRQQARQQQQSSSVAGGGVSLSAQLMAAPLHSGAAGQSHVLQLAASASDRAALLACHLALCKRALQLPEALAPTEEQQQGPAWPRLPDGSVLLPPGASSGSGSGARMPAAAAAVDEAALEQALLRLRQLKDATLGLRDDVAAEAGEVAGVGAAERQATRRRQAAELQRLALAARQGWPPVAIARV